MQLRIEQIIAQHDLDQPFLVQYSQWAAGLLQGDWGYSPTVHGPALTAVLSRAPATAELLLYSLLVFIPSGIIGGLLAAGQRGRSGDRLFRLSAYIAASTPPFILAIVLLPSFTSACTGSRWAS